VYGGFTYTKDTQVAKVGPIEMSIKDKETVNIPIWAGLGAIVAVWPCLFVRKVRAITRDWHTPVWYHKVAAVRVIALRRRQTTGLTHKRKGPVVAFQESRFPRPVFSP